MFSLFFLLVIALVIVISFLSIFIFFLTLSNNTVSYNIVSLFYTNNKLYLLKPFFYFYCNLFLILDEKWFTFVLRFSGFLLIFSSLFKLVILKNILLHFSDLSKLHEQYPLILLFFSILIFFNLLFRFFVNLSRFLTFGIYNHGDAWKIILEDLDQDISKKSRILLFNKTSHNYNFNNMRDFRWTKVGIFASCVGAICSVAGLVGFFYYNEQNLALARQQVSIAQQQLDLNRQNNNNLSKNDNNKK